MSTGGMGPFNYPMWLINLYHETYSHTFNFEVPIGFFENLKMLWRKEGMTEEGGGMVDGLYQKKTFSSNFGIH